MEERNWLHIIPKKWRIKLEGRNKIGKTHSTTIIIYLRIICN